MEANPSVTPSAKILAFPVTHPCPTCGRQCSPDDLSECYTCGAQYCPNAACWECQCDRVAAQIAEDVRYKLTGKPIVEPADENVLALAFMREHFGLEEPCE